MSGSRGFRPKCIICERFVTVSSTDPVAGSSDRKHREGDSRCTPIAKITVCDDSLPIGLGQMATAFTKIVSR